MTLTVLPDSLVTLTPEFQPNTPEIPPKIKFHQTKNFPTIRPLNTPNLWNSTKSGSTDRLRKVSSINN